MLQRSETKTAISRVGYPDRIRYVQMVGRAIRPTRVKPPVQFLTVPDCSTMGVVKVERYEHGSVYHLPERLSNGQVRVDRGQGLEYWKIGERGSNHSLNDGFRDSKWRAADRWAKRFFKAFGAGFIEGIEIVAAFADVFLRCLFKSLVFFSSVALAIWIMLTIAGAIAGVEL